MEIRRGVYEKDEFGIFQSFKTFTDVQLDDSDLVDVRDDLESGLGFAYVKIAVYVLSYGVMDFVNPIYSEPVYLGEVEIPLVVGTLSALIQTV